jgi:hypothetical protein
LPAWPQGATVITAAGVILIVDVKRWAGCFWKKDSNVALW